MRPEDIQYICLKLDAESGETLRELVQRRFGDEAEKVFCDHLTLAYGPQTKDFDMELLGTERTLKADTLVFDGRIAALPIDRGQVEDLGVNNPRPHITLTTFDPQVRPVESNDLLRRLDEGDEDVQKVELDEPLELRCVVYAVPKRPLLEELISMWARLV